MEKFILTILATTTATIPIWALGISKTANLDSSTPPSRQEIGEQSSTQEEVNYYHTQLNHNAYGVQTIPESQKPPAVQADKISSRRNQL